MNKLRVRGFSIPDATMRQMPIVAGVFYPILQTKDLLACICDFGSNLQIHRLGKTLPPSFVDGLQNLKDRLIEERDRVDRALRHGRLSPDWLNRGLSRSSAASA
ncbi:hypothetical protein TIFTF001_024366 [Ficus carica]|uniref:Uncharacterized protein n=1 Tax=Ficus carica TaxID=3494 RepID=A0AA88AL90_FICCA|nr:hypothetical protein TIFTF001_024366 [Ficus carica]